jgi:hypothetical protein
MTLATASYGRLREVERWQRPTCKYTEAGVCHRRVRGCLPAKLYKSDRRIRERPDCCFHGTAVQRVRDTGPSESRLTKRSPLLLVCFGSWLLEASSGLHRFIGFTGSPRLGSLTRLSKLNRPSEIKQMRLLTRFTR